MSHPLTTAEIYVKEVCQAYTTNRVRGVSTSSTHSAEVAARQQAEKLFGPSLISVELQSPDHIYTKLFLATADAPQLAYCWANGVIEYGPTLPSGAGLLASGPARALHSAIASETSIDRARGVLLVPGVSEAQQEDEALEALLEWLCLVGPKHNAHRLNFGVQFNVPVKAFKPLAVPARRAA